MRNALILLLLAAVVAVPILMRPAEDRVRDADETLVVITPHNEATRCEFERAFREHYLAKTGRQVVIDWRTPGGTSEISRFIESEFVGAFENYWRNTLNRKWSAAVQSAFADRRINPAAATEAAEARRAFLESDVSSGIDLFFGGGAYDFQMQAAAGRLVNSGVLERHPEWFGPGGIPQAAGGEAYWDPNGLWVGACLSSFGVCYNVDSLQRLKVTQPPAQWADLAAPVFYGEIALVNPTQSGSVNKAFEMLIQQQMLLASAEMGEGEGVREGWRRALRIIQRASANARYFTDSSSKIPWDVAAGDAAAGMCIDFYGRFQSEAVQRRDGSSRLQYLTPVGGSSVGADPIGLLRGAPNPDVAKAFIDFVLSMEGQKVWAFKRGAPGGPVRYALRRQAIRPEIYSEEFKPFLSDPDVDPYLQASSFKYHAEWTSPVFRAIGFIVRAMCIDPHDELRAAWKAVIAADFPQDAMAELEDFSSVEYEVVREQLNPVIRSGSRIDEVRLAKRLSDGFRARYKRARALAQSHE